MTLLNSLIYILLRLKVFALKFEFCSIPTYNTGKHDSGKQNNQRNIRDIVEILTGITHWVREVKEDHHAYAWVQLKYIYRITSDLVKRLEKDLNSDK